nr:serine acetyltransferase [uncultured Lelliottia sp.]
MGLNISKLRKILSNYPSIYSFLRKVNSFLFLVISVLAFIQDLFWGVYYFRSLRIVVCNHITYGVKRLGAKNAFIPHPLGIVIGKGVSLGYNCVIYQNVTLGVKNIDSTKYPVIGNNVTLYAGALIIGEVKIGDNSIVGAGCLVTKDVPPNMIAYGNPMKLKEIIVKEEYVG